MLAKAIAENATVAQAADERGIHLNLSELVAHSGVPKPVPNRTLRCIGYVGAAYSPLRATLLRRGAVTIYKAE